MFFNVSATVLTGGVAGLELLKSTREQQERLVRENTLVARETEYFKENIGNITSAEELADDPRLLRVALEAYGLGEEFPKKAYIQNILESDLTDPTSAANRVSDPRWSAFAEAFIKSEVTVPGPLNSDFGARMSQRAYAVELTKYTTDSKIDKITADAETFRTAMADIKTATQLVNNRDALNFVKEAFGLTESTATNDDIVGYLNAFNEFKLNDDGSEVVPDEWKEVRSTLSFFNETYIQDTEVTTDKKPNDIATIEEVVLQRFRHELSVETGHYAYTQRQTNFETAMRGYDNVDDFLADTTSLDFVKEAYNLEYDITDTATIKEHLVGYHTNDVPAKWQNVREALGFHTTNMTLNTEDMTSFSTNMNSYASIDDFLADSTTLNIVKTTYGLENDTTDNATLKTYLTAADDSAVPDEFKSMRLDLSHYNTVQTTISDFDTILNNATDFSDLMDDPTFATVLVDAYGVSNTHTQAEVSSFLLAEDDTDVPDEWKQARLDLGFYSSALTTAQEQDITDFETDIAAATDIDDLLNDSEFMDTLKVAYGLETDTATNEDIKTYLLAQNTTGVPTEWQTVRTTFGFYQTVPDSLTEVAQNFIDDMAEITTATEFVDNERTFDYAMSVHGPATYTETDTEIVAYLNEASRDDVPTNFQPLYDFWQNFTDATGTVSSDELATTAETYILNQYSGGDEVKKTAITDQLATDLTSDVSLALDVALGNVRAYELLGWYSDEDNGSDVDSRWQTSVTNFQANAETNGYTLPTFSGTLDPISSDKIAEIISNYNANDESITAPDSTTIETITDAYAASVASITPPDQTIIDSIKTNYETAIRAVNTQNISDFYLEVTGTHDDLTEAIGYSTLSDITERHKEFNISFLDNISKFDRFKKEADNFELSISLSASDADIAADGRSLRFALNAFGLENESFDSFKAFNVLTGQEKLGQSPSDTKWRDFRNNFSFSAAANNLKTQEDDFSTEIIEDFVDNTFIEAVGEQDPDLRLALYFDGRIKELAATENIDDFGWIQVAGETPLATVFQTAFSLPSSFGQLDVDKQREIYGLRAQSVIGTSKISDLTNQNYIDQIIETFLLRTTASTTSGSNATATTLLANSGATGSLF